MMERCEDEEEEEEEEEKEEEEEEDKEDEPVNSLGDKLPDNIHPR